MTESHHSDDARSSSAFKRGVPLLLGIAWNAPLGMVLLLMVAGTITWERAEYLMMAWATTIPVFAITLAHSTGLQRLLLNSSVNIASHRPKLWGAAILWTAILAFWIASK